MPALHLGAVEVSMIPIAEDFPLGHDGYPHRGCGFQRDHKRWVGTAGFFRKYGSDGGPPCSDG